MSDGLLLLKSEGGNTLARPGLFHGLRVAAMTMTRAYYCCGAVGEMVCNTLFFPERIKTSEIIYLIK
jgi:hypothetical protein